jgi:hypothetical protein
VRQQRLVDEAPAHDRVELAVVHLVRAQQGDLAQVEPGVEHQPVETVVLALAAQQALAGVDEPRPGLAYVDGVPVLVLDLEHLDAAGRALDVEDVRDLLEDAEADVLQQRQHLGEHHAVPGMVDAQQRHVLAAAVVDRVDQVDLDRVRVERLELLDVAQCPAGAGVGHVAIVEGSHVAFDELPPLCRRGPGSGAAAGGPPRSASAPRRRTRGP